MTHIDLVSCPFKHLWDYSVPSDEEATTCPQVGDHWNCLQVSVVEKSFVERSHLLDLLRRSSPWVWAAHFVSTEPVSLTQPPYIRTSKWDAFQFQPVKQRAEERQAIKECAGKEWRKWRVWSVLLSSLLLLLLCINVSYSERNNKFINI